MKFTVTFKTPDAKYDALENLREQYGSEGEYEAECAVLDKFVTYGEYLTVEFDSVLGTARVVKVR